jgi:dimeric dUTPase (all-alpha-NTP-PPase superfamily)
MMDLAPIFEKQRELDKRIIRDKGLEDQDLFNNTHLALLVEIGELANETRCFKHWSNKGPSENDVISEEFVDGVHFFISLAINIGIKPENFVVTCDYTEETLTESFLELYTMVANVGTLDIEDELHSAFSLFIGIAEKFLGFTWEEVVKAYERKNAINHERQSSGY